MSKHFGPQHVKNGYAAMGNSRRRPKYKKLNRLGERQAIRKVVKK